MYILIFLTSLKTMVILLLYFDMLKYKPGYFSNID